MSAGVVRVYYVLDNAEIPAFQERRAVEADPAGYLRAEVERIREGLELTVDDRPLELRAVRTGLDQPQGEAGLLTLRVAAVFEAPLPAGPATRASSLGFADRNEPQRLGWREIVVVARGDAELRTSTAPARDLLPRAGTPPKRSGDSLTDLVTRQDLDVGVVLGMLAVALAIGAGHAFLPGHGKTLMGAYLVGTKGRPVDAFLLGAIVSLMHTASVLALGLVLFRVNESISLERVYPSLTVVSGLLAAAFGTFLLVTRSRRIRQARRDHVAGHDHLHVHDHAHDLEPEPAPVLIAVGAAGHDHPAHDHPAHAHAHAHGHGHGHDGEAGPPSRPRGRQFGHSHGAGHWHTHELPPDVPPFSRRGIVMLATSGGLVPSPSAVLVVVSAFSLGRVGLGLSLIAAFSLGLAATLTAIGLSLVFGRGFVERHWGRSLEILPVVGALAMVLLGLALAARGYLAG
jgi:ABC-type nickel/cobalt efflux system permease component RcnA